MEQRDRWFDSLKIMLQPMPIWTPDTAAVKKKAKEDDEAKNKLSLLHELYIELLGSLIPGLFTVIFGGALICLMLMPLGYTLFNGIILTKQELKGIFEFLKALHWEVGVATVVSAYVIGAAFFRQDPKKPDAFSSLYVWMKSSKEERNGLAVQSQKNLDAISDTAAAKRIKKCSSYHFYTRWEKCIKELGLDTQFPYYHIRCYLAARGLNHLVQLVPWCPLCSETKGCRTKMFINILKIRLLSFFPNLSRDVIRNEAHVRLSTSVWYVSSALARVSLFSIVVSSVAIVPLFVRLLMGKLSYILTKEIGFLFFVSYSFAVLLLLLCFFMRRHLGRCVHYMRVREVIYVLEAAYLALKTDKTLLDDIISKDNGSENKLNDCNFCRKINRAPST
ncbi:MAG: hypothetical protein L7F77_07040 [Candidatus Magnetominusculus sp. LBB02]|nr:hypothetical protein [Candidatus Magnetominusculus sp. LBB02]